MKLLCWAAIVGAVVVVMGVAAPEVTAAVPVGPGCQPERATVVHRSGEVLSENGSWQPCVADTGMTTGETGLAIDTDGTLLRSVASGPTGIAVSSDDGASWERRALPEGTGTSIADGWIDPETGRYFYSEASDNPVQWTDDQGQTWHEGTFDSTQRQDWNRVFGGRPVVPRANGYPNNVYYCNWNVPLGVVSQTDCFRSVDGGSTFQKVGSTLTSGACPDSTQIPGFGHGRGIVDPDTGTLYLPVNTCGRMVLLVSADEGTTWTTHEVPGSESPPGSGPIAIMQAFTSFPNLSQQLTGRVNPVLPEMTLSQTSDALHLDTTGRLYYVWIDFESFAPVLATSDDGGQTWSDPVRVSPPDVLKSVLPSLAIAPDGRIGISYYGSTDGGATWTGYLTVADHFDGATTTFETAAVTPPGDPLMKNPCCWANGPQEYTAARWAPDGSLYAAFAGSNDVPFPMSFTDTGQGFVGRLVEVGPAAAPPPEPGGEPDLVPYCAPAVEHGPDRQPTSTGLTGQGCRYPTDFEGESPSIQVTRDGTLFVGRQNTGVLRSTDDGATWETIDVPDNALGDSHAGGAHGYVHVDVRTDRVYYLTSTNAASCGDLGPLAPGAVLSWSDDLGATWQGATVTCDTYDWGRVVSGPAPPGNAYPSAIYHLGVAPRLIGGQRPVTRSLDGGQTWERMDHLASVTTESGAGVTAPDGTIYFDYPEFIGFDPTSRLLDLTYPFKPENLCKQMIAVSEDYGETWRQEPIPGSLGCFMLYGQQRVAVDADGTVYVVWVDDLDGQVHLVHSADHAHTWSDPITVMPPGTTFNSTHANVVASGSGHLVISSMATDAPENPRVGIVDVGEGEFHSYLTETFDATAPAPTFATVDLDPADDPSQFEGEAFTEASAYVGIDPTTGQGWAVFPRHSSEFLGAGSQIWAATIRSTPVAPAAPAAPTTTGPSRSASEDGTTALARTGSADRLLPSAFLGGAALALWTVRRRVHLGAG